jgi:DNA-directed RNA polymerase subunit RPC12/RpoP
MSIPDPIEQINLRVESLIDKFVDEYTCMGCGKKVNYELLCMSPIGDGPAVCVECSGLTEQELRSIGY